MSYIVICERNAEGAAGLRQSPLTNNTGLVHFKTMEEAAREASRLNRQAQAQGHSLKAFPHYWVQSERA